MLPYALILRAFSPMFGTNHGIDTNQFTANLGNPAAKEHESMAKGGRFMTNGGRFMTNGGRFMANGGKFATIGIEISE
jgi:hypothetical protein